MVCQGYEMKGASVMPYDQQLGKEVAFLIPFGFDESQFFLFIHKLA